MLKGGEFSIPFLNLDYSVEDTTVDLDEQVFFVFKNCQLVTFQREHPQFLVVIFHTITSPIGQLT